MGANWNPDFHGTNGDLTTSYAFEMYNGTIHEPWRQTWEALGFPWNEDANGGDIRGISIWPSTVDRDADVREDAARAFLHPVEARANLKIIQGTVKRIVWKQSSKPRGCEAEAEGVEYLTADGASVTLQAQREVILAAGAMRSPLILEASGVGHPA